jgi:organic radical activating enzyme
MQNQSDDYFCVAPWVHVCQNVGNRLKPCCRFFDPEEFDRESRPTINEYFNGEEMTKFRNKILNKEYVKGCSKCYNEDKTGKISLRANLNEQFKDVVDLNKPKIHYLEIGTSNACNFKCITCASNYSTSWHEDDIELRQRKFFREEPKKNKFVITDNEYLNVDLTNLTRLKLLGGEPFMEPRNLQLFERLDTLGLLENLTLELITNASILPTDQWLTYLKKIKNIRLSISLDGIEDVAEFVRYGTDWKKLAKNTLWWNQFCKEHNHHMQFHYVIHAFNCFDISNTLDWLNENHPDILLNFDPLFGPKYLNISYLPDWWKEEIANSIKYIKRTSNKNYALSFLNKNTYDKKICSDMITYVEHLEEMRNHKIPSLYKLYLKKLKDEL